MIELQNDNHKVFMSVHNGQQLQVSILDTSGGEPGERAKMPVSDYELGVDDLVSFLAAANGAEARGLDPGTVIWVTASLRLLREGWERELAVEGDQVPREFALVLIDVCEALGLGPNTLAFVLGPELVGAADEASGRVMDERKVAPALQASPVLQACKIPLVGELLATTTPEDFERFAELAANGRGE